MAPSLRAIVVEDNAYDAVLVIFSLRREGFDPSWERVETAEELSAALARGPWDVVLADYTLPGFTATAALEIVRAHDLDLPFIVVSGTVGEVTAVEMMRMGVNDYVLKDSLARLVPAVEREIREAANRRARREAERSAAHLAALVNSTEEAIVSENLDGVVTSWNPASERLFGWSAAEAIGRHISFLAPADRANEANEILARLRRGEQIEPVETIRVRRDGTPLVVMLTVSSIKDAAGRLVGVSRIARDITQRKRAEEALQASELRYRTLIEATAAIVWNSPPLGNFETEQPGWTAFTGQSAERHRDWGWVDAIHPDDRRKSAEAWSKAMTSKSSYYVEHRLRRADGEYRWMSVRAVPVLDRSGEIREWVGVHTDISERIWIEAQRAALLDRLRLHILRMPLGYVLYDADFRIIDWNPASERIFGYTRAEMLENGPPFEKLSPRSSWQAEDEIRARIRSGEMELHPIRNNLHKDGHTVICQWFNTPLVDERGEWVGILSLVEDVTERLKAESNLRMRDRAIQAVKVGIVITDCSRPDNPMLYVSPGFERMTGYTASEVEGLNCRLLQGKDSDKQVLAEIRKAVSAAQSCEVEVLNYRKDGTPFWNALSISPVRDDEGRLTHFIGVQVDVTARRNLEEQFFQVQKMDAIGQLAGGVAHDFNNLLTIINGYSDMLLHDLPWEDPSRELISEIRKAGERSTGLTRQLLAFSRQQVLSPRILNLNALVADAEKMLRRLIGEDIRLTTSLDHGLGAVRADPGQLEQVLMNLAVNARDAMPTGGRLTIETRNVELDQAFAEARQGIKPGPHVMLSVSDTGCGMTPDVKARIFEPFFTTKGPGKGTGLGLATVFGIIRQSGGTVAVQSEVGLGTTFKVYLPLMGENLSPSGTKSGFLIPPRGTETLLIVEDEEGVRTLARLILKSCGYTVLEAENGDVANRVAREQFGPIHLILTDVIMPGAGGKVVADRVREHHPDVRVLYVSGYTDDAMIRHGITVEQTNFLQKPFSPLVLALKVREVLDQVR